jgi:type VI secretion system protein ImpJ
MPEDLGRQTAGKRIIKRDDVNCWLWLLELTTEQEHPDTVESFRFAEYEKQADGVWMLSSRFIPPLLCVGKTPFLKPELTQLAHKLESYHYHLTQEIAAIYLSGSDLINARQSLKSVVQIQRFLNNLFAEITPHPYVVYEQLKSFYVELCFYHNVTPHAATAAYRHEKLAEIFLETFELLNEQLQCSQRRSPYLPFTLQGGALSAVLPESIREAKEIYLLVQKGGITATVNLDGLKIAARSRIPVVHKFYLQGITLKRLERPPFQHSFGPEVDLYQLTLGEEWDHALQELALGFYADSKYAAEKFFLYWRAI